MKISVKSAAALTVGVVCIVLSGCSKPVDEAYLDKAPPSGPNAQPVQPFTGKLAVHRAPMGLAQ